MTRGFSSTTDNPLQNLQQSIEIPFVLGESFFGREKEMQRLHKEICRHQKSMYFLLGPPNCGKSRLMNEFLYHHMGEIFAVSLDLRSVNMNSHKDFMHALEKSLRSGLEMISNILKEVSNESLAEIQAAANPTGKAPLIQKIAQKVSRFYPNIQPMLQVIGTHYENAARLAQMMDKILEFEAQGKKILDSGEFDIEKLDQIIDTYWKIFNKRNFENISRTPMVELYTKKTIHCHKKESEVTSDEQQSNPVQEQSGEVATIQQDKEPQSLSELPTEELLEEDNFNSSRQFLIFIDEVNRLAPLVSKGFKEIHDTKAQEEDIWNIDNLLACFIRNSKQLRKCTVILSATDSFLHYIVDELPSIRSHTNTYKILTMGFMNEKETRHYLREVNGLEESFATKLQETFGGDIMSLNDALEIIATPNPSPEVVDHYIQGKIAAAMVDIDPSRYARQFKKLITPEMIEIIINLYKQLASETYVERYNAEVMYGIENIATLVKINVFYDRRPENISNDIPPEFANKSLLTAASPLHHRAIIEYVKKLEKRGK